MCWKEILCVCVVHFSKYNFLMQECGAAKGSRGEVRSDWLHPPLIYLSELCYENCTSQSVIIIVLGGLEAGRGCSHPPLHSAGSFLCRSGKDPSHYHAIMIRAVGSWSFHMKIPFYWPAGPSPSTSLLTLAPATQRPLPVSLARVGRLVWFRVMCLNTCGQVLGHTLVSLLSQNRKMIVDESMGSFLVLHSSAGRLCFL